MSINGNTARKNLDRKRRLWQMRHDLFHLNGQIYRPEAGIFSLEKVKTEVGSLFPDHISRLGLGESVFRAVTGVSRP
jgi:hypothetical protein